MTCRTTDLGNGVAVIACSRGERKRSPCAICDDLPHEVLCDFPLSGRKAGKTCDMKLCRRCASHVAKERDLCPAHARIEKDADASAARDASRWLDDLIAKDELAASIAPDEYGHRWRGGPSPELGGECVTCGLGLWNAEQFTGDLLPMCDYWVAVRAGRVAEYEAALRLSLSPAATPRSK